MWEEVILCNSRSLHPVDQLLMIMDRIYSYGMTTTSGGNLSILDDNGDIWITPAGVDKGSLTVEVVVERQEHSPIEIRLYSGFFYLSVQVLVVNERQELVPTVDVRQELVPITEVKYIFNLNAYKMILDQIITEYFINL
jgi:hypothetical protein